MGRKQIPIMSVDEKPMYAKKFAVPFNFDTETYFETVVKSYSAFMHSVYMAPPSGLISSARAPQSVVTMDISREAIKKFTDKGIKTFIAINGAWHSPTTYTSENFSILVNTLMDLHAAGLTGIIIGSAYIANAGFIQEHIPDLKVIPTVNNMFDSFEKAKVATELVGYDGVVWDRNVNPDIEKLKEMNKKYKEAYPDKLTAVLLNEGCLRYCPFKRDHDPILSMISYADEDYYEYLEKITKKYPNVIQINGAANTLFGCHKELKLNPKLIESVPYIDSTNLEQYIDAADVFKLSGRTHQTMWIASLLRLYLEGTDKLPRYMLDSGLGGEFPCT